LSGGQSLIPEMDRQMKALAEFCGQRGHLGGLRAGVAAHVLRISNNNFSNLELLHNAAKLIEVRAFVLTLQSFQSLGSQA